MKNDGSHLSCLPPYFARALQYIRIRSTANSSFIYFFVIIFFLTNDRRQFEYSAHKSFTLAEVCLSLHRQSRDFALWGYFWFVKLDNVQLRGQAWGTLFCFFVFVCKDTMCVWLHRLTWPDGFGSSLVPCYSLCVNSQSALTHTGQKPLPGGLCPHGEFGALMLMC